MSLTRLVLTALLVSLFQPCMATTLNLIQKENRQPGTTAWQLTNPADNRQIEGYASLTSVPVGGNISLFVNTNDPSFTLTVYRMGWYGGTGGRRVWGPQTLPGLSQVTPDPDPVTGTIECHWTNPFTIHVPASWLSGMVFQQSVITYQAYNPWPGGPGGWVGASLYEFNTNLAFQGLPGYLLIIA